MKKISFLFFLGTLFFSCTSTSVNTDILSSSDPKEMEAYLAKAHPEDPKREILKKRIIALKNEAWTQGRNDAQPMEASPVSIELSNHLINKKDPPAKEEIFNRLMAESSEDHKTRTLNTLNRLFDEDINAKEVALLVKNNSECNLVLVISGKKNYRLAVPKKGENYLVLEKGTYTLLGDVCDTEYHSTKTINKSLMVILQNSSSEPKVLTNNSTKDNKKNTPTTYRGGVITP